MFILITSIVVNCVKLLVVKYTLVLFFQPSVEVDAGDGFLVADYPDELGGGVDDVGDIGDIGVSEPMMDGFMDEVRFIFDSI